MIPLRVLLFFGVLLFLFGLLLNTRAEAAVKRTCMFPGEVASVRADGSTWCEKPAAVKVVGKRKARKVKVAAKRA